jgi:L-rhamnose mutarotase
MTQKWWEINEPLQQPVPERNEGEWWMDIPEIFHTD